MKIKEKKMSKRTINITDFSSGVATDLDPRAMPDGYAQELKNVLVDAVGKIQPFKPLTELSYDIDMISKSIPDGLYSFQTDYDYDGNLNSTTWYCYQETATKIVIRTINDEAEKFEYTVEDGNYSFHYYNGTLIVYNTDFEKGSHFYAFFYIEATYFEGTNSELNRDGWWFEKINEDIGDYIEAVRNNNSLVITVSMRDTNHVDYDDKTPSPVGKFRIKYCFKFIDGTVTKLRTGAGISECEENEVIEVSFSREASAGNALKYVKEVEIYYVTLEEEEKILFGGTIEVDKDHFYIGSYYPYENKYSVWYSETKHVTEHDSPNFKGRFYINGQPNELYSSRNQLRPEKENKLIAKHIIVRNNIPIALNVFQNNESHQDRVIIGTTGKIFTYPEDNNIDIVTEDGDSHTGVASHGPILFAFKKNTLYVINTASSDPSTFYLQSSHYGAGVDFQASVVETEVGVFWANKNGIYHHNGEALNNITFNRIEKEWIKINSNHIIAGYDRIAKKVIFIKNKTNVFVYDLKTQSFTKSDHLNKLIPSGDPPVSNFSYIGEDSVILIRYTTLNQKLYKLDFSEKETPYEIVTKAYDLGEPSVRKKVRRFYVKVDGFTGPTKADATITVGGIDRLYLQAINAGPSGNSIQVTISSDDGIQELAYNESANNITVSVGTDPADWDEIASLINANSTLITAEGLSSSIVSGLPTETTLTGGSDNDTPLTLSYKKDNGDYIDLNEPDLITSHDDGTTLFMYDLERSETFYSIQVKITTPENNKAVLKLISIIYRPKNPK